MEKLTILTEIFWNILRNNQILLDLSKKKIIQIMNKRLFNLKKFNILSCRIRKIFLLKNRKNIKKILIKSDNLIEKISKGSLKNINFIKKSSNIKKILKKLDNFIEKSSNIEKIIKIGRFN